MRLFNDGWSFCRTELDVEAAQMWDREDCFGPVDIPHDWLIYDVKNLYQDGIGWYRKRFAVQRRGGERVILRFEGVYMDSAVYLNRRKVMEWKYGYSTFDADVTEYLADGENDLMVQVRFQSPNSRWYSGAGIYRNVWMKVCPAACLPLDGTYVTIAEADADEENAGERSVVGANAAGGSAKGQGSLWKIQISTEVRGCEDGGYRCRYTLCGHGEERLLGEAAAGAKSADGAEERLPGEAAAAKPAGCAYLEAQVEDPLLWDVEEPNCYQLKIELLDREGNAVDTDCVTVGFRTVEFTTDRGFFLNHRHLKLHGVCEHHDLGCLGAAFHREAMRRKFKVLREMGVNALRTSHNMPAPELMELADAMGFLVVDEAFDMWELPKTQYDYARFFVEWAERDVASWVRRDRNHPCLIMWSIGNEIYDTHAGEHGQEITRRLSGYVRRHDPRENAKITIGSNYMPWENAQKCADIVKMAGYNYGEKYYAEQHAEHPDWVIYGSETASVVYSRGVYHFPLAQACLSEADEQCSALGNSTTSWGAQDLGRLIGEDRDCDYSLGQFLWTGFDYIGEPTPYHTKNSYFGQIDTAGFPKDSYYVFQSDWRRPEECPMVHLFPYWDWNEGQLIDVQACTTGDSVELFVNGRSYGRQEVTHRAGNDLLARWQVAYEPGELLAVAYDAAGNEIARERKTSFGDSAAVTLSADKTTLRADGEDLCFVTIGMVDGEEHPVENAMDHVTVRVDGPGRLLGLDNGDSTDYDEYKTNCRKLFNGKLLAVIGTTPEAGEITVRVDGCAGGIEGAALKLYAEEAEVRDGVCCAENCDGEKYDGNLRGNGILADKSVSENTAALESGAASVRRIPVRKIEMKAGGGRLLTPDHAEVSVEAVLLPENATDREIVWEAVNDMGIPIGYVKVTPDGVCSARVEACGDGPFRVRCQSKDNEGRVRVISQLEFTAEGFGQSMLNPYKYMSASLYTRTFGEVGAGNEKGISFARDGWSAVTYERVDFGEYGSDTITMDVFALDGSPYRIEVWEGIPERAGDGPGRLLDTLIYEKPSIWNTYQAESWKLPERLSGVKTISFAMYDKVHVKGFSFAYLEKAFQRLTGADASSVYGDSFRREGSRIADIGNNVTVCYEGMDFGDGAASVTIEGSTPLPANTIHLRFVREDGAERRIAVEYPGGAGSGEDNGISGSEQCCTFPVEGFCGKGKLELVFLPGSDFNLNAIHFER